MASPPTTPMSQASTKVGSGSSIVSDKARDFRHRAAERVKQASTAQDILIFLVAFRVLNAFTVATFFQPDEYFQSLEPAWEIAFGADSGAWITWEWRNQLRSSIHPALFAVVYWVASSISHLLQLSPLWHADLLIAAPKVAQAVIAALGDYYTWKLGEKVHGAGSNEAWAVLAVTVCSPWQWFCSTRTFSNCLETTLTTVALSYWPWGWSAPQQDEDEEEEDSLHNGSSSAEQNEELSRSAVEFWDDVMQAVDGQNNLRRCLVFAAIACILRPTNVLIWICFASFALFRVITYGKMVRLPWFGNAVWVHVSDLTLFPATKQQRYALFREATLCGSAVLLVSILIDRLYYQTWAFPPFRFLYFNIAQSLAVFYGRNRWDYYFTEGLPLLLTTLLPFTAVGIYQSLFPPEQQHHLPHHPGNNSPSLSKAALNQFATTSLLVPLTLSLISHKEVRFIYPLLPTLHILASGPFAHFFVSALSTQHSLQNPPPSPSARTLKRIILAILLSLNALIAYLSSTSHQPGPLSVLSYLRSEHATHDLSQPPPSTPLPRNTAPTKMTVGFLMPCHSTPWRSHLVFPTIDAWALTCSPPINLDTSQRANYVDEADRFYADPQAFIEENLGPPPLFPSPRKDLASWPKWSWLWGEGWLYLPSPSPAPAPSPSALPAVEKEYEKEWPEYLIFFEQLEPFLRGTVGTADRPRVNGGRRSAYRECWRGFNSWGHDDWRRKGDVVVWCSRPQTGLRKGKG